MDTSMGKEDDNLDGINIVVMRSGTQLNYDQRESLLPFVTDHENQIALKGIGDLKVPKSRGYGAKFFKSTWDIVKEDVMAVVSEFFLNKRMYKVVDNIVVTLISKGS